MERETHEVGPVTLVNVHAKEACLPPCPIHSPSDHHMRTWMPWFSRTNRLMYRLCPEHGNPHPDPDEVLIKLGFASSQHECCGCCHA